MEDEVIYITKYNKNYEDTVKETLDKYQNTCIICQSSISIKVTTILSQDIYPELSHEAWNNITLCTCCKEKLEQLNLKDDNGFKNIIQLIKDEYKKKIQWLQE